MQRLYTGIDIGTYHVKVVIAAPNEENPEMPMRIVGSGSVASRGMRHGYIINHTEAAKSIREALDRASQAAKTKVTSARVALGGVGLDEIRSTGEVTLTQSGGIVNDVAIERAKDDAKKRAAAKLANRTVIHSIPLEYRIDGARVFGEPTGLTGTKLATDTLLITMLAKHYEDLIDSVEDAGVEVEGVMASPLAASLVTLTRTQKMAGVVLANIGSETLSIAVFEEDVPQSVKVFPVGSGSITESIALTFQIPLTEAESLKRGGVTGSDIPERKMQVLIASQLRDMYTLVNAHLKAIGRQKLLPAGIVITGGGSGIASAADIARAVLKLPSQVGQVGQLARATSVDATWAVAYGLCRWAYADDMAGAKQTFNTVVRRSWESFKEAVKSLMP